MFRAWQKRWDFSSFFKLWLSIMQRMSAGREFHASELS